MYMYMLNWVSKVKTDLYVYIIVNIIKGAVRRTVKFFFIFEGNNKKKSVDPSLLHPMFSRRDNAKDKKVRS